MRIWVRIAVALVAVYLGCLGAAYWLMCQPPIRFASAISKVSGPVFVVLPFETLWFRARAGRLHVGEAAPDFRLPTLDRSSEVELASLRGKQPVVLIFGSYT